MVVLLTARTKVGIIGAGPAGLLLSHLLALEGIDSVVLESRSRRYVEERIRAGVLEQGTVDTLRASGAADRLDREGLEHAGIYLRFDGSDHHIDFPGLTGGRKITVYGQQEVVKDLIALRLANGGDVRFEARATRIEGLEADRPVVVFEQAGEERRLECDYVAGCDGYHGISRHTIPNGVLSEYVRDYPFAWLGVLAEATPASDELIYAHHKDGFALHSMRSPTLSRNYVQVDPHDDIEEWPDERFWETFSLRMETHGPSEVHQGPITDKTIATMRSFVVEPMQYRRLFLAGDAAHIVPPTGAKGLNLAVADVRLLAKGLTEQYREGRDERLSRYSRDCLRKVWRAQHFSWWMTSLLHRFPDDDDYGFKLQLAQLRWLMSSEAAARSLAENYVGWIDSELDEGL